VKWVGFLYPVNPCGGRPTNAFSRSCLLGHDIAFVCLPPPVGPLGSLERPPHSSTQRLDWRGKGVKKWWGGRAAFYLFDFYLLPRWLKRESIGTYTISAQHYRLQTREQGW